MMTGIGTPAQEEGTTIVMMSDKWIILDERSLREQMCLRLYSDLL